MRRAIVGLGNPGRRYEGTPHNVGFRVIEALGARFGAELDRSTHGALWGQATTADSDEILLVKPQRYMNRSGGPTRALIDEHQLAIGDVLVVHDDLDLDPGRIKLKRGGGTAGHRGLESMVEALGDAGFARLRLGIGRPADGSEPADFVLERVPAEQEPLIAEMLERAVEACLAWLSLGIEAAMNRVNGAASLGNRAGSGLARPASDPVDR